MDWLWLTLGAVFLFSLGAHVDKHLLSRYFRGAAPGSLILFSSLFGFAVLPALALVDRDVLAIAPGNAALLVAGGCLNVTGVILSLHAMQADEPSVVATLFQMVPVFGFVLAWAVLGEALTGVQAGAGALVLGGAVFASLDLAGGTVSVRRGVLGRMALASLLIAANAVLFKRVAIEEDFWVSTFWSYVALALVGVVLFAAAPGYRRQFLRTLRANRLPVIGLNVGNEVLAVLGYLAVSYASLLAPVALVTVVAGVQPAMVFAIGVVLTLAWPRVGREDLSARRVAQKLVAIAAVVTGTVLLHR